MSQTDHREDICYTTLALGYEYNQYAKRLAEDVAKLSPNVPILILTDRPQVFHGNQNVIAVKHKPTSVGLFHDKLLCVEKCLERFACCIFIDADCRLIKNMALSRNWKPGLTAKTCWELEKHILPAPAALKGMIDQALKSFGLSLGQCTFIYEGVFVVRADNGKEQEFLKIWKSLRDYFESHGILDGEGVAMGLAAEKVSMKIYHYCSGYNAEGVHDVYKDKLFYKFLIHKSQEGLSDSLCETILSFDQERRKIQALPLRRKIIRKILNPTLKKIRFIKLKIRCFGKRQFIIYP